MIGEVMGAQRVFADLDGIIAAAHDLSPAWPAVGKVFADRERRVFTTGQRRWAPLAAGTLRRKTTGRAVLINTGGLRADLANSIPVKSDRKSATFGARTVRARKIGTLHRYGTATMPARDPLPPVTGKERAALLAPIRDHIVGRKH